MLGVGAVKPEGLVLRDGPLGDHRVAVLAETHHVVPGLEHVAAHGPVGVLARVAVGGHVLAVEGELEGLRLPGGEKIGLCEVHQLARGLLDALCLVHLGVGRGRVELDDVLAADVARVRHRDTRSHVHPVIHDGVERLREARVREAKAKREHHRVVVREGRVDQRRRLVVAVPHVHAFLVLVEGAHEFPAIGQTPGRDGEVVVGVQPHAHVGGVRREVARPGVDGAAAGVDVAVEQRGELREAALAGVAVVDYCINLEASGRQVANLHGGGANDHRHDCAADALGRRDGTPLALGERKVVGRAVGVGIHLLVLPLLSGARDKDDARCLGALGDAVVDGGVVLVDAAVAAKHGTGLACGGGALRLLESLGVACRTHGVDGGSVDREGRKALLGRHRVNRPLCRAARGELPVDGVEVCAAKRHDHRTLDEREHTGVLEEHRALVLDPGRDLIGSLLGLIGVGDLRGGSRHFHSRTGAAAQGSCSHGPSGNRASRAKELAPGHSCLSHGYSSPCVTCTS